MPHLRLLLIPAVLAACADDDPSGTDAAIAADASALDAAPGADAFAADAIFADAHFADASPGDAVGADVLEGDAACVPSGSEVCDGADNDCNGFRDDVDVGGDGIFDCQRIAVFGTPGSLGSSDFNAWLTSNGVSVVRTQTTTSSLTADLLSRYDVVILDRLLREYTPDEAAILEAWVEAGGGLMSMTGYTGGDPDRTRPGSLLAPFGISYQAGLRSGPVTRFNAHPTTDGLTSITFSGGFRIETSTTGVTGTSTVVARLTDGVAGLAHQQGDGRVFVWGDEWIEFDSEWRALPEVPRFWAQILGWLRHFR